MVQMFLAFSIENKVTKTVASITCCSYISLSYDNVMCISITVLVVAPFMSSMH